MRARHPASPRLVGLVHDKLAEFAVLSLRPPMRTQLGWSVWERVLVEYLPLTTTDRLARRTVNHIEPVARWVGLMDIPESLLRLGDCGFAVRGEEAKNGKEELGKGLVWSVVGKPYDIHDTVHLFLCGCLFDAVLRRRAQSVDGIVLDDRHAEDSSPGREKP